MSSIIYNQVENINRLVVPLAVGLQAGSPSLSPIEGSLGYNLTDDHLYLADGTNWAPITTSSGGTGTSGHLVAFGTSNSLVDSGIAGNQVVTLTGSQAMTNKQFNNRTFFNDVSQPSLQGSIGVTGIAMQNASPLAIAGLTFAVPSANSLATIPNVTGNVVIDSATQTLSAKTLASPIVTTGITLPATGGTPSQITDYEIVTTPALYSGIWSSAQGCTLFMERTVSPLVTKVVVGGTQNLVVANTAALITVSVVLPVRFRPAATVTGSLWVVDDTTTTMSIIQIATGGTITIGSGSTGANFAGSGLSGPYTWTVTYFI